MKEFWDFDENKNFIKIGDYKVLNKKHATEAAELLEALKIISTLGINTIPTFSNEINLLKSTPFHLQEMQLLKDQGRVKFDGLNKPKNVYKSECVSIGKDTNLRADNRLIFLTLRHNNGKLKNIETLLPLLAHELTHTALNHVRWRDDDHDFPFDYYEDIIYDCLNSY